MNRDVMEAHLVVLGWWPVRLKPYSSFRGWSYCVRSDRQYCGQIYNRIALEYLVGSETIEDTAWWRLTDDVLRKIVHTVDSAGMGWSGE